MRIVSLLPSATEILCAVGGRPLLVGRSHECDHPPGLADVPALTQSSLAQAAQIQSAAIDASVRDAVAVGSPLYALDEALLATLAPDLVITQDLCRVCSIDLACVERAVPPGTRVLSLNPSTIEDILDDHLRVGDAAGLTAQAEAAVHALRSRLWHAQQFVHPYATGPVVGFMEWTDPIFIAGHWTVQLIERAGGRHPLNEGVPRATAGAAAGPMQAERVAGHSVRVPAEVFAAASPEYLVIAPCGLPLDHVRREADALTHAPWFNALPAVRAARRGLPRVALVDGNQMFNRPGPRVIDAFEFLVGWLNDRPELIPPDFPWEPMRLG